jgi:hypothetical protein
MILLQKMVSSGAVTNIVNEWRRNLGFAAADELRELAVTLKKVGITALLSVLWGLELQRLCSMLE